MTEVMFHDFVKVRVVVNVVNYYNSKLQHFENFHNFNIYFVIGLGWWGGCFIGHISLELTVPGIH